MNPAERARALTSGLRTRLAGVSRRTWLVLALVLVLVGAGLVAWRLLDDDSTRAAAPEPVPTELRSTIEDPFGFVEHDGETWLVGHRLVLRVDPGWHVYDTEHASLDGTTWEWAGGEPEPTADDTSSGDLRVPTYVAIYAGIPNRSATFEEVRASALADAQAQPGFVQVESGEPETTVVEPSAYLRFTRQVDYRGEQHTVEEVSFIVEVQPGVTTRLRMFSPAGEWDADWSSRLASLRVSP